MKSTAKPCQWLPGKHRVTEKLLLPDSLGSGNYSVSFGILNPTDYSPAIRMANKGTDPEGWFHLGIVEKQK
jgi:hypothetical protein